MEEKVYLDKLAKRDIKPTAIRLLILKSMMEAGVPCLSLILKRCWIRLINRLYPVQHAFFVSSSDT